MRAAEVFNQNDGAVTTAYYQELNERGAAGRIAVALFRAQKRSSRAKDYRRGRFRRMAYDVKSWSIEQLCELLTTHNPGWLWGWKQDPKVLFGDRPSWVLYIEIRSFGQVSFHSPERGKGPDYPGEWDGQHASEERIIAFCDAVMMEDSAPAPTQETPTHLAGAAKLRFGDPESIRLVRGLGRR